MNGDDMVRVIEWSPKPLNQCDGQRFNDRRCPACDSFQSMTNPHTSIPVGRRPEFLCRDCGTQFDAGQETE